VDGSGLLIAGSNGQLGRAMAERWPAARTVDRDSLDIADEAAVKAFDWSGVRVLMNAAAYTKVDLAETAEGRRAAWAVNARATANLARIAAEHDITLVHISTDYVFDGTKPSHTEDEDMAPLGVYGQSKAAGDVAASVAPRHYLVRTSWVIGDGPNFVRTMMSLARKNISPKVVDDHIGRLTFTGTLVDGIETLLKNKAPFGTYNLTDGGEAVSWAEITRAIFAEMGRNDLTVTGVSTAEYFKDKPEAAPRPLLSALDLTKIEAAGVKPADWRTGLHAYINDELAKESV